MIHTPETIAAVATPPGRGGVGIVRVSGPDARQIGLAMVSQLPSPRRAVLRPFLDGDGQVIDEGVVLWMPGPGSFTGEDVLELHGHGGPVVMDLLLARIIRLGARPARPGEFSERAFLNDRLDLAQAEAIADLIDSGSVEAARAAARSLTGELSAQVHTLIEAITGLRVYVEAAIDFPEEEVDFLGDSQIGDRLRNIEMLFDELFARTRQSSLLREGMTVVIAGAPNAGKSSLLNRLAGYEAAIVTEIPGTTRDVLREHIDLDGMPLHVIDTAGLRTSDDPVEQEGVRRAQTEMATADRVLLVVDSITDELPDEPLPAGVAVTVVYNKVDLLDDGAGAAPHPTLPPEGGGLSSQGAGAHSFSDSLAPPREGLSSRGPDAHSFSDSLPPPGGGFSSRGPDAHSFSDSLPPPGGGLGWGATPGQSPPVIRLSAKTGQGLNELRAHLEQSMGYVAGESGVLMARQRHIDALERARAHAKTGRDELLRSRAGELLAEELRLAQQALAEITGEFSSDDLLGRIFSSFCIGK